MNPFVFFDLDNKEIIFLIKNTVKRFNIDNIDKADDFIDEFYRRFKCINFCNKYNKIDRKEFMDLIDGLKTTNVNNENNGSSQEIISKQEHKENNNDITLSKINFENSSLIRSNTERKISIEDLGIRFDEIYDYYDLSVLDPERVNKSSQLKFFLDRGMVVRTSMEEISSIRSEFLQKKEEEKKMRQEAKIVNRSEVQASSGTLTEDDFNRSDVGSGDGVYIDNSDLSDTKVLIRETFSREAAIDDSDNQSIDSLLRRT